MNFPCTSCGACCRRVYLVDVSMAKENGHCINLNDDNTCNIYDTRPEICRINFNKHKKTFSSEKAYFEATEYFCKSFIDLDGMDKKYHPDTSKLFIA